MNTTIKDVSDAMVAAREDEISELVDLFETIPFGGTVPFRGHEIHRSNEAFRHRPAGVLNIWSDERTARELALELFK